MKLTAHAAVRLQQRHLSPLAIDLLQHYGKTRYQRGATVLFFDEKGRHRAERALRDALARFDKIADAYLIEAADSGDIVTVGYRYKRIEEK